MTTVFVQFSDSSQTKVQTVFGCAQDHAAWPNQGEIEDTDNRYLAFITPDFRAKVFADLDAMRIPVYNALAGYGFTAMATGDTVTASAIAQVQIGLRGLKTLPAVVAATNETDIKTALMAGFKAVVAAAPASVLSAFVGASL